MKLPRRMSIPSLSGPSLLPTVALFSLLAGMSSCGVLDEKNDEEESAQQKEEKELKNKLGPASVFASDERTKALFKDLPVTTLNLSDLTAVFCPLQGTNDCAKELTFKTKVRTDKDGKEIEKETATKEGSTRTVVVEEAESQQVYDGVTYTNEASRTTITQIIDDQGRVVEQTEVEDGSDSSKQTSRKFESSSNPSEPTLETVVTTYGDSKKTSGTRSVYGENGVPPFVASLEEELDEGEVSYSSTESCEGLTCTSVQGSRSKQEDGSSVWKEREKVVTTFIGGVGGLPERTETTVDGKVEVRVANFEGNSFTGYTYSGESMFDETSEPIAVSVSGSCTFTAPDSLNCTRTLTNADGVKIQETVSSQKLKVIRVGDTAIVGELAELETQTTTLPGEEADVNVFGITVDDAYRIVRLVTEYSGEQSRKISTLEYDGDSRNVTTITTTGKDGALVEKTVFTY